MQMHYINLNKAVKTKEIMDTKKQFRLLYIPEIDAYFMEILVRIGKCFSAFRLS